MLNMKPETIERLKNKRISEQNERHKDLICRLTAKAKSEGKGSIWAEMLKEITHK